LITKIVNKKETCYQQIKKKLNWNYRGCEVMHCIEDPQIIPFLQLPFVLTICVTSMINKVILGHHCVMCVYFTLSKDYESKV